MILVISIQEWSYDLGNNYPELKYEVMEILKKFKSAQTS